MDEKNFFFDKEINAAIGIFQGFLKAEDFKKSAEGIQKLRIDNKSNKQLNNIKDMKVLTSEIRDWLQDSWFPKASKTGLKYFAFVVPKDTVGHLSMNNANKKAESEYDIEIKYFENHEEARQWLLTKK